MKPDHRDGPTQAQIEAAAKALAEENGDPFDELSMEKYRGDAKAALTAAAQVAAEDIRSSHCDESDPSVRPDCSSAALTAAAEIGEPAPLTPYGEQLVDATKERCARVAEDWGLGRVNQEVKDYPATCAAAIAYAIRKLKDEA